MLLNFRLRFMLRLRMLLVNYVLLWGLLSGTVLL
jgi:hypothetical protein